MGNGRITNKELNVHLLYIRRGVDNNNTKLDNHIKDDNDRHKDACKRIQSLENTRTKLSTFTWIITSVGFIATLIGLGAKGIFSNAWDFIISIFK